MFWYSFVIKHDKEGEGWGKQSVRKNGKGEERTGYRTYIWKHKYLYLMLVPAIVYYIIFVTYQCTG